MARVYAFCAYMRNFQQTDKTQRQSMRRKTRKENNQLERYTFCVTTWWFQQFVRCTVRSSSAPNETSLFSCATQFAAPNRMNYKALNGILVKMMCIYSWHNEDFVKLQRKMRNEPRCSRLHSLLLYFHCGYDFAFHPRFNAFTEKIEKNETVLPNK